LKELAFKKLFRENERHLKRLRSAFKKINELGFSFPLTNNEVELLLSSEEGTMVLDQIAYRFSKLQDSIGKLIRNYLYLLGENVENLPMIDVINLAQRIGLPISEEKWFELRALRNAISHEYEEETEKIANLVNRIYKEANFFSQLLNSVKAKD